MVAAVAQLGGIHDGGIENKAFAFTVPVSVGLP
jgi:hypothetical protein